jgi:hypothetical protein
LMFAKKINKLKLKRKKRQPKLNKRKIVKLIDDFLFSL